MQKKVYAWIPDKITKAAPSRILSCPLHAYLFIERITPLNIACLSMNPKIAIRDSMSRFGLMSERLGFHFSEDHDLTAEGQDFNMRKASARANHEYVHSSVRISFQYFSMQLFYGNTDMLVMDFDLKFFSTDFEPTFPSYVE